MTSFIDDDGNELRYNGDDFAVTKQVISFHEFKIKANVSVNIKVSNTAENRQTLGFFGSNQINPIIRKSFSMIRDGNKIDRGALIVSSFDMKDIELFFISGNGNLFDQIDFNCNEILTSRYNIIGENTSNISATWSNKEGIVYPIIDFVFGGQKNGNVYYVSGLNTEPTGGNGEVRELIPCCYIHTILREVFIHANVSLTGDILNDPFFLSLILTPESVDDIRVGPPNSSIPGGKLTSSVIKPEHIAPRIKVIDFLKWIAISFGGVITFDIENNSCDITLLDKVDKSTAKDWSDYYVSHKLQVDRYYQFNYIRYRESDELRQEQYNKGREVRYGDALIESDKNDFSVSEIYKSPFYPSYDVIGDTKQKLATPICEAFRLKDKEQFSFSSVSAGADNVSSGGGVGKVAQFNGTGFPFDGLNSSTVIFRVASGIYRGFHVSSNNISGSAMSSTSLWSDMPYIGNSSGTFWVQEFQKISGHKVLSCITGVSPSAFSQYPNIILSPDLLVTHSTVATAYFSKIDGIYTTLKNYPQGLNYGSIDEGGRHDKSLKDSYLNRVSGIIQSPPIKAIMLIPKDVFHAYINEPVFIKAETLQGYYLVEKIENYVDEITPVNVYLLNFV